MALVSQPAPFDDPAWLYEIKYDGFRAFAVIERGQCRFISRNKFKLYGLRDLASALAREAGMTGQRLSKWIFLGPTRQRMSNELVRKAFRACLTAAELRQVRFHDLRHTFASLLIQQGANPKIHPTATRAR